MSERRLFGNKISPACKYCMEGYPGAGNKILCRRRGLVDPDSSCRSFLYDPLAREPKRPVPLEQYDEKAFSLD